MRLTRCDRSPRFASKLHRMYGFRESNRLTFSTDRRLDGIWIIDAAGDTVLANARMGEILKTSPSEMIGQSSFSYIFPEDEPAARRLFEAKSEGDSKPFHFRLRRKDGSEIWVDVQGTPMRNASGEFNGIVGTFTVAHEQVA
jgi:PAS domain S-box-containing protein